MPDNSTSAPLDHATLNELYTNVADNVPEIILELIDIYLDDSNRHFKTLPDAIASADYKQVQLSAHSLKSSSATFGAHALSRTFAEIEAMAREQNLQGALPKLAKARALFADVERFLLQERDRFQ